MSEPIKVGDLVMVVCGSACCDSRHTNGWIFVVDNFYTGDFGACRNCGKRGRGTLARRAGDKDGWDLPRLKRIPPLPELEGQRTQEDIREPA